MRPIEWRATTPRQLVAMSDRRRERIGLEDLRMARMFAPVHSFLYSKPVSPAQVLGLTPMDTEEEAPAPGSSDETREFLAEMGAVKRER